MSSPASAFSSRFTRAAAAEQELLDRRLGGAKATVRERKGELAAAEAQVAELEARLEALAPLLADHPPEASADRGALRGRAIRAVAVAVLRGRGPDAGPIHYRRWLALVEAQAGPVAGKRPDSVFLNQVTRHPLVRSTTRAGFYELDLAAGERLEARVGELRRLLASVATAEAGEAPPARARADSRAVALELARAERALGEARDLLPAGAGERADDRKRGAAG